jgi:hypothetical protein
MTQIRRELSAATQHLLKIYNADICYVVRTEGFHLTPRAQDLGLWVQGACVGCMVKRALEREDFTTKTFVAKKRHHKYYAWFAELCLRV